MIDIWIFYKNSDINECRILSGVKFKGTDFFSASRDFSIYEC